MAVRNITPGQNMRAHIQNTTLQAQPAGEVELYSCVAALPRRVDRGVPALSPEDRYQSVCL